MYIQNKIFGVGLSRTGTLSLTTALRMLGYSALHCPTTLDSIIQCDAATDTPIAATFKSLDLFFAGSQFILTDRDQNQWLRSCERFFASHPRMPDTFLYKLRKALYGTPDFNVDAFIHAKEKHIADVMSYFASRPGDLLVLRICEGEGWEKLCPFLGKQRPDGDFPWENENNS